MKCTVMNCNDDVVYSGVDAFMLGIPTEKICYSCANIYNKVKEIVESSLATN